MRSGERGDALERQEARLAWWLIAPALSTILLVALFPLAWTLWESVHLHDLRMPWLGRPFIGAGNYLEAVRDPRFWAALGHTAFFTAISVTAELGLGLALALAMNRANRGRTVVRAAVLVPWAIPTVVSALLWRFIFDDQAGIVNSVLSSVGVIHRPIVWFIHPDLAWVPVIVSDVWKTTPFVALIALAGLQTIDPRVYEAAALDGASRFQAFRRVTLPLLRPALVVAVLFRAVEALRIFDLVYVLTRGGPGGSTETVSVLTYLLMFQELDMGQASAAGLLTAAVAGLVAAALLGTQARAERA